MLRTVMDQLEVALDAAGKTERLLKKRVAPAVRIVDATDVLDLVLQAFAEARSTGNLDLGELDESLVGLKESMSKLAAYATRGIDSEEDTELDGVAWLLAVRALSEDRG